MVRTTVKISEELDARLRHEAERRGLTISDITREALEAHLGGRRRVLRAVGAGNSGYNDTARRMEELLAEEFGRPERS